MRILENAESSFFHFPACLALQQPSKEGWGTFVAWPCALLLVLLRILFFSLCGIWLSFFAMRSFFSHVFGTWHLDLDASVIAEDLLLDPDTHAPCCGSLLWVHGFISVNLFVTFFQFGHMAYSFFLCHVLFCLVSVLVWARGFCYCHTVCSPIWTPLPCWPVICLVTSPVCLIWLLISASVQLVCVDLVPVHFGCYTCQSVFSFGSSLASDHLCKSWSWDWVLLFMELLFV